MDQINHVLAMAKDYASQHQAYLSLATAAAALLSLLLSIYNTFRWRSSPRLRHAFRSLQRQVSSLEHALMVIRDERLRSTPDPRRGHSTPAPAE